VSQVIATGGDSVFDITDGGTDYRVHVFTTVGTSNFVVSQGGDVEYLVVAGGGSGGSNNGGGGGAGGLLTGSLAVTPDSYPVAVGAGGSGVQNATGINGGNSSALGLTALGGGGGGSQVDISAGRVGGSGGGAGANTARTGSAGTAGQGNRGGNLSGLGIGGTGGGGAGAPGEDVGFTGGNGGDGVQSSITGTAVFYAGGGGGQQTGLGGQGGGGDGSDASLSPTGNAVDGLGGGGGGGRGTYVCGAGGSGIVIIRYVLLPPSWKPVTAVTLDGVDYTGETIGRLSITRGRRTVYDPAPAGYCRLELIDLPGTGLPIDIAETLEVTVEDSAGSPVTVFSGYVTDIAAGLYDPGIGGTPAATYTLLAVGPLARLARRTVLAGGRPAETDGQRILAAVEAGLSITWEEYPAVAWEDVDAALTWETVDPGFDADLIETGIFDLSALDPADGGYTALEVAEQASDSGDGYLYETLDGFVAWANADSRGASTSYLDIPHDVIQASGLRTSSTISDLANRVTVNYTGGSETSQDSQSIETYTLYTRIISTTLANASNASDRADQYVERHAYPAINLDEFSIRLDTIDDLDLIDALLEVTQNTPVNLTGLPATLGYTQIPGFVEGTTLALDRFRAELRLTVSDATLSFGSIRWSAVPQSLTWDDLAATLTWEDARSL